MKQKTILLVEDEVLIAMMKKKQLENEGYKVIHAITGEKALDLSSEKKEAIDLILMDIDLGKGIDGTEAAQQILKDQDIPILFLSSHIEKEIVNKTEKITNYGYVVKDSTFTVLDASIKMAFKLFDAKKSIQNQSRDVEAAYKKTQDANKELIKTKNNLTESELRYKSLFQNLYNSFSLYEVIFNEDDNPVDYRILAVNPAYEKTVGVKASEVLGKTLLELFPKTESIWLEIIERVVLTGTPELIEHYAVEVDKYIEQLVYIPQKGQMAFIASDVTDRKKAEEKLRKSNEKIYASNEELLKTQIQLQSYESMILYSSVSISLYDVIFNKNNNSIDYRYLIVNPAYEKAVGKKRSDLLDKTLLEVFPKTEPAWLDLFRKVSLTGISDKIEHFSIELNRYYEVFAFAPQKGRLAFLASDITERKQAENKIKNLLSEKELILKEVHHRIKNNMNTIKALLQLQSNIQVIPESKDVLQDAVGRLNSMIVLYEKLYRSDNIGKLSLKEYIPPLIKEIVEIFPLSVKTKLQIDDILLDAKLLSTLGIILNEMITNSIKHAFHNSNSGLVTVSASAENNTITIMCGDNGIGLPESINLEHSMSFGINLIRMLVQQINGTIKIERNNGTRFIIEIKE